MKPRGCGQRSATLRPRPRSCEGAPHAVQVAERFHLLKNVTDSLERFLARNHTHLRQAAQTADPRPPLIAYTLVRKHDVDDLYAWLRRAEA